MLSVRGVSKRYGKVAALLPFTADFRSGEIHAVMGENGAGKSTLMQILAGFTKPDEGSVVLGEQAIALGDPVAARNAGVAMVHQHFTLVGAMTVLENLALSQLQGLQGLLDLEGVRHRATSLADSLRWEIRFDARANTLPVGVRQRVEILKVLLDEARVLIFDEPTAVLTPEEVTDFFRVVRQLRDQGRIVLLIGHKLAEVMGVADQVTILRRGELIATAPMACTSPKQIAEWMIGELTTATATRLVIRGQAKLRAEARDLFVRGDDGRMAVQGVGFAIYAGEVLGFGGVDGNGQLELAEALAGMRGWTGHLRVPLRSGYIPQDRQTDGLALSLSLLDNFLIEGHERDDLSSRGFLSPRRARAWAKGLVDEYRIKIGALSDPASSLSGGNQQKLVVSRILSSKPEFIVCVNPTRGLDFHATQFVLDSLRQAADAGAAVALISTDRDELAAIADRVLFLSDGRLYEDASALAGMAP